MVFRKPYAFLIQYFQRIHLFLLGLCFYLFYKTTALRTFVSEFIRTESYNQDLESIKHYVGFLPVFVILLCLGILLTLMILLRHKKKPWKTYLFPFINYIYLLIVMLYIRNFFMGYNELSDITKIMAGRDLLFIAYIPQFAVFLLLILRTLGIDLNRFGFKNDKEYLEIKEDIQLYEEEKEKETETIKNNDTDWMNIFKKKEKINELNRLLIDELIEDIVVSKDGNIKVIFKYEDKYFEALDFINKQKYDTILSS